MIPLPNRRHWAEVPMARILRIVSGVGFAAFATWFAACALAPQWLERRARAYVTHSIRGEIVRKYPRFGHLDSVGGLRTDLRERAGRAIGLAESDAADVIAMWLSLLCKHDCSDRSQIAAPIRAVFLERVRRLGVAVERVEEWVQGRYDAVVSEIVRDLRIFTGSNAIMFLLAFVAALLTPRAPRTLAVVSGSLVGGAVLGTGLYIFGQNWLYTLVFANYFGTAYAAWVAVIVGVLLDLVLNRGRIVRAVVETITGALSAAGT